MITLVGNNISLGYREVEDTFLIYNMENMEPQYLGCIYPDSIRTMDQIRELLRKGHNPALEHWTDGKFSICDYEGWGEARPFLIVQEFIQSRERYTPFCGNLNSSALQILREGFKSFQEAYTAYKKWNYGTVVDPCEDDNGEPYYEITTDMIVRAYADENGTIYDYGDILFTS